MVSPVREGGGGRPGTGSDRKQRVRLSCRRSRMVNTSPVIARRPEDEHTW
jgi:hypothetical protein